MPIFASNTCNNGLFMSNQSAVPQSVCGRGVEIPGELRLNAKLLAANQSNISSQLSGFSRKGVREDNSLKKSKLTSLPTATL